MNTELDATDFTTRGARAAEIPKPYGRALLAAARQDSRIVALTADLASTTETDIFRDAFPDRFFQVGIAEANMTGIAGGMARFGDIPVVHTFSVFATRRAYDQVAMQVAYPNLPVKIVGFLPGVATLLGVSHQSIDDLALMRALPNMTVLEPADSSEVAGAVEAMFNHDGPVYLRLARAGIDDVLDPPLRALRRGGLDVRCEGADGLIVACGLMVAQACAAAETLRARGVHLTVVNAASIKPLSRELIALAARAPLVITAENHSIIGGLGSAVCELLMEAGVCPPFARIGLQDTFAEGGSLPYLQAKYGLDSHAVIGAVERLRVR